MPSGQPGAVGDAPESTDQVSDYLSVSLGLRNFRSHYRRLGKRRIVYEIDQAAKRATSRVLTQFRRHGGDENQLAQRPAVTTQGDQAYRLLREVGDRAEEEGNRDRSGEIGRALYAIDDQAVYEYRKLVAKHHITVVLSTQPSRRLGIAAPTTTVPATPPPARAIRDFDWIGAYRQLQQVTCQLRGAGPSRAYDRISRAFEAFANHARLRFVKVGGKTQDLPPLNNDARTRAEQRYLALVAMSRRPDDSGDTAHAMEIREYLDTLHGTAARVMHKLACEFGPLDELVIQAEPPVPQPRVTDAAARAPVSMPAQGPGGIRPATPGDAGPTGQRFSVGIESAAPGATTPAPAGDVPEIDVPETDLAAIDLPEIDLPAIDLPEIDLPAIDAPAIGLAETLGLLDTLFPIPGEQPAP